MRIADLSPIKLLVPAIPLAVIAIVAISQGTTSSPAPIRGEDICIDIKPPKPLPPPPPPVSSCGRAGGCPVA